MELSAGKYWSLRRLADANGFFKMTAADQRPPIMNVIEAKTGKTATFAQVADMKSMLIKCLAPQASAILMDPVWAVPHSIQYADPAKGLIITLEDHQTGENDKGGRLSKAIDGIDVAKIKRMGGDAVKVLAWYRPDGDADACQHQQDFVEAIGKACKEYDIPFVFELLVYPLPGEADQTKEYAEHASKQPANVLESVKVFADPKFGIDIFKLESPIPAAFVPDPDSSEAAPVQEWFNKLDAASPVPWVMLSAGADMDSFERVLTFAFRAGASGFLAGRAIWLDAVQAYPDMAAIESALMKDGIAYAERIGALAEKMATPWHQHRAFTGGITLAGGNAFPKSYDTFPG